MAEKPIVIIGSGLAGYMLAKEWRKLDANTPLRIITASDGRFYSKPLLSTALTANKDAEGLAVSDAGTMTKQLDAEIITATEVQAIDVKKQRVKTATEDYPYAKLVLACGADVIRVPLLGNAVKEIRSVNDLEAYSEFRKAIHGQKRIAILGAGLVGCEFANDLANVGHEIHVIAPSEYPLDTLLPIEVGRVLQAALSARGVQWYLEQLATSVDKSKEGYLLTLSFQQQLQVDVVLSAIGLKSRTALAETAGIKFNRGIVVGEYLQTSAENVYALGDCAEVNGLVMLFVAPLLKCARALAKTLAGEPTLVKYPAMPVIIKTPACPIVVSPQPRGMQGEWRISGEGQNLKALFYDTEEHLHGFALTGEAVKEKNQLVKELPPLL